MNNYILNELNYIWMVLNELKDKFIVRLDIKLKILLIFLSN